jgi:Rrf2 family protein
MCHVAHRGYASAQTIANQQAIPSRYLEEIIGELRKAGLVVGKRGPRGGYRLAKPPQEIAVSEILYALAGTNGATPTGEPVDEISTFVEREVDARLEALVHGMNLDMLLGEARDQQRRNAASYVI